MCTLTGSVRTESKTAPMCICCAHNTTYDTCPCDMLNKRNNHAKVMLCELYMSNMAVTMTMTMTMTTTMAMTMTMTMTMAMTMATTMTATVPVAVSVNVTMTKNVIVTRPMGRDSRVDGAVWSAGVVMY